MPVEKKNQMPLSDQMDGPAQQYCLRWKYHHSNLQEMFAVLLERESFCDVTLACEGKTLRAHKVVLSACSTYFDTVFSKHEERDPIVILKDVKFNDLKAVVEFMYKGEINVDNSQLTTLLQTAEDLKIKGLAAVSWKDEEKEEDDDESSVEEKQVNNQPKARKRKIKYDPQYVYPNAKVACIDNQPQPVEVYGSQSDEDSEPTYDNKNDEEEEEKDKEQEKTPEPEDKPVTSTPQTATPTIRADLLDVIKMTAYIQQGGRRPHFWETSSTKRVMEAIKNKEIEMKVAAEILGVSYGTLYGRYRDAYGCLKHPYRVREFWHEAPSIEVIGKLQRKELSLFKAAEILNVTVTTLANYLAALNKEDNMAAFISQDEDGDDGMKTKPMMTPDLSIVKEEAPDEASNSINGN